MIALGRNHATNARVRQNVVIHKVRQASLWSQVSSFSGSQDSSHSPRRGACVAVMIFSPSVAGAGRWSAGNRRRERGGGGGLEVAGELGGLLVQHPHHGQVHPDEAGAREHEEDEEGGGREAG